MRRISIAALMTLAIAAPGVTLAAPQGSVVVA